MPKTIKIPPLPRDDMSPVEQVAFYRSMGIHPWITAHKPNSKGEPCYGVKSKFLNDELERISVEWLAYEQNPPGGLGRTQHFHNLIELIWPQLGGPDWNPWTERTVRALVEDEYAVKYGNQTLRTVVLTGCATASKTFTAGMFACAWWMIKPQESIVILTSTTGKMVRRRIWPVIQLLYETAQHADGTHWQWGHMLESQTTVQRVKGDDLHAVFAKPVAEGETQKAAADIRGMHAPRIMLVIDEANGTPEAIFETIPNLRKTCRELIVVIIHNPVSHMDCAGRAAEPLLGWASLNPEKDLEWRTKGVDKWQLEPGICLRFDGKHSPNVLAGVDKWPFIYTNGDWKRASDPDKERTLGYWSQDRGFWPADGTRNTIFNESLLAKYDPTDGKPFTWMSRKRMIAFLDVAFTGDEPVLQFAELGDIDASGKMAVQLLEPKVVPLNVASRDEADYQLARYCIEACKSRGMIPQDFGLDRTGNGSGVAAIIRAEWGPCHQIEFGEMATERPATTADGRPSREVYANRVTEIWYSCREFLEAGQLRGVSEKARQEFCAREYELSGRRYKLMPKADLKAVLGRSCDTADAIAGVVDIARSLGASASTRNALRSDFDLQKLQAQANAVLDASYGHGGGTNESGIWTPPQHVEMFDRSLEGVGVWD